MYIDIPSHIKVANAWLGLVADSFRKGEVKWWLMLVLYSRGCV